jgi:hypothetical protein
MSATVRDKSVRMEYSFITSAGSTKSLLGNFSERVANSALVRLLSMEQIAVTPWERSLEILRTFCERSIRDRDGKRDAVQRVETMQD